MKSLKKAFALLSLLLVMGVSTFAQVEVVVHARPPMPRFERPAPPSPRHVWIGEEWEPRGGTYAFVGGHWAEPPHPGWAWIPGHWRNRPGGEAWVPGHWRRN